jgi:hypothetical protein
MTDLSISLIAAGSAILGTILGGTITLSADQLKARREERARLRDLRLGTYSQFLSAAKWQMDTSMDRVMVMLDIRSRRDQGKDTSNLDSQLERLERHGFDLEGKLSEMEIIASAAVLSAAQNLKKALEEFDDLALPRYVVARSTIDRLQGDSGRSGISEELDPAEQHKIDEVSSKFSQAKHSVEQARSKYREAVKHELRLNITGQ